MHFAEYDFVFTILKSSLPFYAIAQHVSVQNVILCLNLVNVRFLLKIHLRFKSLTSMTSSDYICTWMNKSLFEELHKFFDDFLSVDKCRSFKISTKSLNLYNCKYIYIFYLMKILLSTKDILLSRL